MLFVALSICRRLIDVSNTDFILSSWWNNWTNYLKYIQFTDIVYLMIVSPTLASVWCSCDQVIATLAFSFLSSSSWLVYPYQNHQTPFLLYIHFQSNYGRAPMHEDYVTDVETWALMLWYDYELLLILAMIPIRWTCHLISWNTKLSVLGNISTERDSAQY